MLRGGVAAGVVALKIYHESEHVKNNDHFIFLFEDKAELFDFVHHALTNIGDALVIENEAHYPTFDRTMARHSRHAAVPTSV